MGRKYVLDGAIVKCSMGMAPAKLMVVTNQRVKIQGKFKATHMDRLVPQTFIQCKLKPTPGGFLPCTPMLLPWQKTAQKTNLRGMLKFLYDDSYSMCGFGGKVTVVHPMQINAAGAAFEQYTNISTTIPGAMPLAGFDEGTLPESESNSFLDSFQTVLDIAGLVPGFGEIADGINAAIYVARGDYANAALSAAAMIPIGGQAATAAKLAVKVAKEAAEEGAEKIAKEVVEEVIEKATKAPPPKKNPIYRQDNTPNSPEGSKPGRVKSHVNADGKLVPANKNGQATVQDHVKGSEPRKSDSPYTSFSQEGPGVGKTYGDNVIELDVEKLEVDIQTGKVKDVEVVRPDKIQQELQANIDQKQAKYDANPSKKNKDKLDSAKRDLENTTRDKEVLVKGEVPAEYIQVYPTNK